MFTISLRLLNNSIKRLVLEIIYKEKNEAWEDRVNFNCNTAKIWQTRP